MPASDWTTEAPLGGGISYTWRRYEIIRVQMHTNNILPIYHWKWVAKYRGRTIKEGGEIEELMDFCEMFDRHRTA